MASSRARGGLDDEDSRGNGKGCEALEQAAQGDGGVTIPGDAHKADVVVRGAVVVTCQG